VSLRMFVHVLVGVQDQHANIQFVMERHPMTLQFALAEELASFRIIVRPAMEHMEVHNVSSQSVMVSFRMTRVCVVGAEHVFFQILVPRVRKDGVEVFARNQCALEF
jgi:rRNA maturation protein Rpf1